MKTFQILLSIIIFIIVFIIFYYLTQKCSNKKKESMKNFDPSGSFYDSLESIFKHKNMNFNHYPYVEIKPDEPLFTNNKVLPECCIYNNEYSTDKGCPCITPDQQYYLQRRGINKHNDDLLLNQNMSINENNHNYKNIYFSPSLALKGEMFPYNPLTSKKYNIHYVGNPPEQFDSSINEFILMTNYVSSGLES
tara:strand:- start:146 stop:724 length:579 start_codon:yes stop_codon:yes gene_type:complete